MIDDLKRKIMDAQMHIQIMTKASASCGCRRQYGGPGEAVCGRASSCCIEVEVEVEMKPLRPVCPC